MIKSAFPLAAMSVVCVLSTQALAQSQAILTKPMALEHVTVFLRGAELEHTGTISAPSGVSELLLTDIADSINQRSISLNVDPQIKILSTQLVYDYVAEKPQSNEVKKHQDELDKKQKEKEQFGIRQSVLDEEIAYLKSSKLSAEKQTAPQDAKGFESMLNLISTRLMASLTERASLAHQLTKLDSEIARLIRQIKLEKGQSDAPTSALLVKFYTKKPLISPMKLTYVVDNAGWQPEYDVRVENTHSPLILSYKANLYQRTGLNWEKIHLTLATTHINEGINAPAFLPWPVDFSSPMVASSAMVRYEPRNALKPVAKREKSLMENVPLREEMDYQNESDENAIAMVDNSGVNVKFEIPLPYSIKSHSRDNILSMKDERIDVKYRHVAFPKQDNGAFLQAQIADWGRLTLLPGASNVYFDGVYVGEGFISTQGLTKETLDIALGRDKNVMVSRQRNQHMTSKPTFFGDMISQQFGYVIEVKNTRTDPIELTVFDQFPIVKNAEIKLSDLSYSPATYHTDEGRLSWKLTLKPNESKQLPFGFTIKYPKDKIITGL